MGTSYNSFLLFMHSMYSNFFCFIVHIIMKVMSQSSHLPQGPINVILWGGIIHFSHFRVLHSIASHFPSCLPPSITDDTHIIGPLSIISSTYEHFQTKLHAIGFPIQPYKCIAWSPSTLPPNFNTPSERIRLLKVPLGTLTFTKRMFDMWIFSLKWVMFKWLLEF
jgi:hypothetical protein